MSALEPISIDESKRRNDLESRVKTGIATFFDVGRSLCALRDERLYRNDFENFECYCQSTFGFTARRGRQLMAAAEVVIELEKSGTVVPLLNEASARALAPVPAAKREAVLAAAKDSGKVTSASIKAAAKNLSAPPDSDPAPSSPEQAKTADADDSVAAGGGELSGDSGKLAQDDPELYADRFEGCLSDCAMNGSLEQMQRLLLRIEMKTRDLRGAITAKRIGGA